MAAAHIDHFTPAEVLTLGSQHEENGLNQLPPLKIVHAIMPTLALAEALRRKINQPVIIISGFRSAGYNKAIGGAKGSLHLQFRALDIRSPKVTPDTLHSILIQWRKAGQWRGGLGLYPSFVHIDDRSENADWRG